MAASSAAMGLAIGSRMLPPEASIEALAVNTAARVVITVLSFGNGVVAGWAPRTAPAQSMNRQVETVAGSVACDRLDGILRAGRGEAAGGHPTDPYQLVGPDQGE